MLCGYPLKLAALMFAKLGIYSVWTYIGTMMAVRKDSFILHYENTER